MNRLDFGLPGVDGKGTKLVAMDHFNAELLIAANRSLHWIFQSFDAYQKRPGTTIGEALAPHVKGSSCELINPGLVLAAAYIYFLYPKETAIHRLNLDSLDTSAFRLDHPMPTKDLLRRLRNSLAHGRFEINDSGRFEFQDQRHDGSDAFRAWIDLRDFGDFVDNFGRLAAGQLARG